MVASTPIFSFSHDSQDNEDSGADITELQYVLHTIQPKAIDGLLVKALENHGLRLCRMSSC